MYADRRRESGLEDVALKSKTQKNPTNEHNQRVFIGFSSPPAVSRNMETVNSEDLQHLAWVTLHIRDVLVDSPQRGGADHSPELDGSLLSSPAHTSHLRHEDRLHFLGK